MCGECYIYLELKMKRIISLFLLSVLAIPISAQMQRGLKGSYNIDSFPNVSFVWNSPNPELMSSSSFALYEGESPVDFNLTVLPIDKKEPVEKSILFLWEDMASHGNQSTFTQALLTEFFSKTTIANGDRFEVAVFDRKKDSEKSVLTPLLGQFSSDSRRLIEAISNYSKRTSYYPNFPQQSDLYMAINEGVTLLKKEPENRSCVMVVVTAGLNMKAAGASTEMETVRKNAVMAGIPVYVIKYPVAGDTPEVNILAESTYGNSSSTISVSDALDNLQKQYVSMDDRLRGHDYQFRFTAQGERDGLPHPMRLIVDKVRRPLPPYLAPKPTFGMWLVRNWWIVALVILLVAGGIVLVMMFVKKKNVERDEANKAMQEQMRREHEESERRSRETVEAMRREQEDRERTVREAAERERIAVEEERLCNLMQTKNLFPRLKCMAGNETLNYTINKPHTTIGRNEDNDVAFVMRNDTFNNQTVSGRHAEIVFNGSAFEVVNLSRTYTQGIIVNGQFYQRYTLHNGDMIGLGEAIVTFYL